MQASTRSGNRYVVIVAGVLLGVGVLLPWWRNHALLRDFYDYGNIMAGVGRMELGDRPYVDFLTPIQTLQFYAGLLAERIFGARYLSLTYLGALFTLGTFAAFVALLIRPLGAWLALLVSSAVVVASSSQHTIVWYNAMGVTWLAVAMWVTARHPKRGVLTISAWALVWAVLWLGGMTKVTYHLAALAFVVVFTLRSTAVRDITRGRAAVLIAVSVGCAVAVPIATEMFLTGASFVEWKKNVFELALSRMALLEPIATWSFYWQTPHDYHRPLYMPFVGAWGMVLAIVVGAVAAAGVRARGSSTSREYIFLLVAWGGVVACGLAFLALHFEIAYLSGAAWLVLATGLVLAFVPLESGRLRHLARGTLALGAITLLVPAWMSAWGGARAVWGHRPLVREELVLADDLPPRFSYLRGLRILPEWHMSLQSLNRFQDAMADEGVGPERFYFVNGTDWLVRAFPKARHGGLPLWLQYGTTFTDAEMPRIARKFDRGAEMEIIVSHHAWNEWPGALKSILDRRYRPVDTGGAFESLRVRADLDRLTLPLEFARLSQSNLYSMEMTASGGRLEMFERAEGSFLGAAESAQLTFGFGLYRLSGEFVAEFDPELPSGSASVTFRVRRMDADTPGQLLWDEQVALTKEHPRTIRPFSVSPGGGRVVLEVLLPAGGTVLGGWSRLQTDHAGESLAAPRPLNGNLATVRLDDAGVAALAGGQTALSTEVTAVGRSAVVADEKGRTELAVGVPSEVWIKLDRPTARIAGAFRTGNSTDLGSVKLSVVYYKSGRFDNMHDVIVPYGNQSMGGTQSFDVGIPQGTGWIGLIATPVGGGGSRGEVRWSEVRLY